MARSSRRPLVAGAVALALSGAVASAIGGVYHIVVVRMAGAEAIGLFQMAMPVYRLAAGAASLGFNIAVVRLIANSLGRGRPDEARRHARTALRAAAASGPAACLLLWLVASRLAVSLFREPRLIPAMTGLGLLLVPTNIGSVLAGIVQGFGGTPSLAWAGVVEAVVRVPTALALVTLLAPWGTGAMAAGMIGGMIAGELGSLAALWRKARPLLGQGHPSRPALPAGGQAYPTAPAETALLKLGIPLMVSGLLNSVVGLINTSLVPRQLQAAGLTQGAATQAFGQMAGMVTPLLHMPMLLVGPVLQVVIPAIAELTGSGRHDRVIRLLRKAFLLAGAAGIAAAALFTLAPAHIAQMLYGAPHIAPLIRPLAVAAPVLYIGMIAGGVLIGLGQVGPVTVNVFAGNLTRTILIVALASRPSWGILGAIWALVADHSVTAVLHIACLGWFLTGSRAGSRPATRANAGRRACP